MTSALKHLPKPIRWIIRPMLFLSLALHGLVLFFPVSPAQKAESEEDEAIAISLDTVPPPKPSDSLSPLPTTPTPPVESSPAPAAPEPPPSPAPLPTPIASPPPVAAPSPSLPVNPSPETSPTSAPEPSPEPSTPSLPPAENSVFPFAGFPHLSNAQSGCFGLSNCRQVDAGNFRQVGSDLIDQLTADGYTVSRRDDLTDTGINVYEVSRAQTTQYLSILSSELGSAVYVLASEPVTVDQLQTSEPLAAEFKRLIEQATQGQIATVEQFWYPDLFFTGDQPRAEIAPPIYAIPQASPAQVTLSLTNQFSAAGFAMDAIGTYGGASVYKVDQEAFVAHFSILPTQDGAGSIIVVWNELPETAG